MKRCYIVCYDIADDKRLKKVADIMKSYGTRIQYSVFRCELTPMKRAQLEQALKEKIHHKADQVLFIDLGLVPGHGEGCIRAIGRPYLGPDRKHVVF